MSHALALFQSYTECDEEILDYIGRTNSDASWFPGYFFDSAGDLKYPDTLCDPENKEKPKALFSLIMQDIQNLPSEKDKAKCLSSFLKSAYIWQNRFQQRKQEYQADIQGRPLASHFKRKFEYYASDQGGGCHNWKVDWGATLDFTESCIATIHETLYHALTDSPSLKDRFNLAQVSYAILGPDFIPYVLGGDETKLNYFIEPPKPDEDGVVAFGVALDYSPAAPL